MYRHSLPTWERVGMKRNSSGQALSRLDHHPLKRFGTDTPYQYGNNTKVFHLQTDKVPAPDNPRGPWGMADPIRSRISAKCIHRHRNRKSTSHHGPVSVSHYQYAGQQHIEFFRCSIAVPDHYSGQSSLSSGEVPCS